MTYRNRKWYTYRKWYTTLQPYSAILPHNAVSVIPRKGCPILKMSYISKFLHPCGFNGRMICPTVADTQSIALYFIEALLPPSGAATAWQPMYELLISCTAIIHVVDIHITTSLLVVAHIWKWIGTTYIFKGYWKFKCSQIHNDSNLYSVTHTRIPS